MTIAMLYRDKKVKLSNSIIIKISIKSGNIWVEDHYVMHHMRSLQNCHNARDLQNNHNEPLGVEKLKIG